MTPTAFLFVFVSFGILDKICNNQFEMIIIVAGRCTRLNYTFPILPALPHFFISSQRHCIIILRKEVNHYYQFIIFFLQKSPSTIAWFGCQWNVDRKCEDGEVWSDCQVQQADKLFQLFDSAPTWKVLSCKNKNSKTSYKNKNSTDLKKLNS